jgi:sulfate transport system substrate-binding protein
LDVDFTQEDLMKKTAQFLAIAALVAAIGLIGVVTVRASDQTLLNASYDSTRDLYHRYDALFAAHWAAIHPGSTVTVNTGLPRREF